MSDFLTMTPWLIPMRCVLLNCRTCADRNPSFRISLSTTIDVASLVSGVVFAPSSMQTSVIFPHVLHGLFTVPSCASHSAQDSGWVCGQVSLPQLNFSKKDK